MDTTAIVSLIGTLGFPIVMCIILVYYILQLNKTHKEEIEAMTNVLQKNTEAITALTNEIKKLENEVES